MTTYSVDLSNQQLVHFRLTDLKTAKGYGLHISPGAPSNGDAVTELYLVANGNQKRGRQVELHCQTGDGKFPGYFRVDLGNTEDILHLDLSLTPHALTARTVQLSRHKNVHDRVTYDLGAQIPTERGSGFWQSGKILVHPNGLHPSHSPSREGQGFGTVIGNSPKRNPRVDEPQPDDYRPVIKISGPVSEVDSRG